jgi:hypothetical protein
MTTVRDSGIIRVYQYEDVVEGWTHDRTTGMFTKGEAITDARRIVDEGRVGFIVHVDPALEVTMGKRLVDWDKTVPKVWSGKKRLERKQGELTWV